jgi:hypothetical protein
MKKLLFAAVLLLISQSAFALTLNLSDNITDSQLMTYGTSSGRIDGTFDSNLFVAGNSNLDSLSTTGLLNYALTPTSGKIIFDNAQMVVILNENTAPEPEPATKALLGLGVAGLAVYGKRKHNKEA